MNVYEHKQAIPKHYEFTEEERLAISITKKALAKLGKSFEISGGYPIDFDDIEVALSNILEQENELIMPSDDNCYFIG